MLVTEEYNKKAINKLQTIYATLYLKVNQRN